MNWFVNLPTRLKLFVSFGVAIALMVVIILTATRSISVIRAFQDEIYNSEYANTVDLMELSSHEGEIRISLLMMLSATDKGERDVLHQRIRENTEKLDRILETLFKRNDEDFVIRRLEELDSVMRAFVQTRDAQIIPLIYAGKTDAARKLAMGIQAERYQKMAAITKDLQKVFLQESEKHIAISAKQGSIATWVSVVVGSLAVLLSIILAAYLNRIIAKPLNDLSGVAERVSRGDLTTVNAEEHRPDEVGVLSKIFKNMVERLRSQTTDITDAVNVLASSSNEIAATTAQLASGTEQTAVAVTETTTTVEEVKQTATISSQKARHVADLAQNAVHVSQAGSKLVLETIEGITHIREQMEYIAETIVKLSEHNQAIGEVIATVDEMAEQANLLAVNASIEASKAGEHGKGFIIVAQEIKSLAEQSKQATKQVRTILNDIQKASTAAVMATEKGSKAVEATVRQSSGTGDSIQELSKSISEASQAVLQIAASNQQQLVGMDQVALAMTNIRQATTQNAASTKQVEVTVRNLQELGQKLKKLVEHYRV